MFKFPQKKTVDSVMATFTQAITDLKSVAETAQSDAQSDLDRAESVRKAAELQVTNLQAKAKEATAEAARAEAIITKLTALVS